MAERDPLKMGFADQIVTSDRARFQRSQDFLRANPQIRLAGPTWGWLQAAYRSMSALQARGYAEAIATTPVLVLRRRPRPDLPDARHAARSPRACRMAITSNSKTPSTRS